MAEKWFSDVKAGERKAEPVKAEPVRIKGIVKKTITDKVPLPQRIQAWIGPGAYTRDDAEMEILSYILGGHKGSRLCKRLVYDSKIAREAASLYYPADLGSQFCIEYIPLPGHSLE